MHTELTTAAAEKQANHSDVFAMFAGALKEHLSGLGIDPETVARICDDKIAAARLPRPIEVHLADQKVVALGDRTHRQFEELLGMIQEGHRNLLMVGPAGTGKTTLILMCGCADVNVCHRKIVAEQLAKLWHCEVEHLERPVREPVADQQSGKLFE